MKLSSYIIRSENVWSQILSGDSPFCQLLNKQAFVCWHWPSLSGDIADISFAEIDLSGKSSAIAACDQIDRQFERSIGV